MSRLNRKMPDSILSNAGYLLQTLTVIIDRPAGSKHPKHGFIYPINYGYLPGTQSGDGEEMDAYVLGVQQPISTFTGICIAVIHRMDDDDDKLVLTLPKMKLSDDEIRESTYFQEQWFHSIIIRSPAQLY